MGTDPRIQELQAPRQKPPDLHVVPHEPPHNADAERSVLGAMLLNEDAIQPAIDELGRDGSDFYVSQHAAIYEAILALFERGEAIDTVTLPNELVTRGRLEFAGGMAYLGEITNAVPTSARVSEYARIVHDKRVLRDLMQAGDRLRNQAYEATANPAELVAALEARIDEIGLARSAELWPRPTDTSAWPTTEPPALDFIFDGMIPMGVIAGLDAAGGSGKGYFTEEIILSACSGIALLKSFRPTTAGRVLWVESEDPPEEIHRRFHKIATAFGLSRTQKEDALKNLLLFAGVRFPLIKPETGTVTKTNYYRRLEAEVKRFQPRLIVIDPRSHFFGGDENSNTEVAGFMQALADLTKHVEGGAAVWVNHHTSKERQDEPSSAAGRGASAGRDAQRVLFSLNGLTDTERRTYGVTNPDLFVKLTLTKANWIEKRPEPILLRRDTDATGTGGVLHELDAAARARETAQAVEGHMSKAVAEWVGDNPGELSVTDLWNRPTGKEFRDAMRNTFGARATKNAIREALLQSVSDGNLTIERVITHDGKKCREIPKSLNVNTLQKVLAS